MTTLYTLMFLALYGYNGDSLTSETVQDLSYGDCAETLVKLKNNQNNLRIIYGDCIPQSVR